MTKNKPRIPEDLQRWIDARKRFHLSHAQVQMARELGMNPRKLGSLDNHKQERWKAPLPVFIEQCYRKHFGKAQPDRVISVEDRAREMAAKKAEKRERRRQGAETFGAQQLDQSKRRSRGDCLSGRDPSSILDPIISFPASQKGRDFCLHVFCPVLIHL